VILDGIDEDGDAAEVLQDGCHVGVQGIADGIGDERFAIFGAEDEVNMEAGEGLGHGLGRPFQGLGNWSGQIPRALPKAVLGRAVGAKTEGAHTADIPIQEDHLGIGREDCAMLTPWFLIFSTSWNRGKDKYKSQKSQCVKQ